ncbi:hypothetical protein MKW92_049084 [Papaver armeniacum]|nr:hypothetical protein MKW92_049084 [Papaver armeniacum]
MAKSFINMTFFAALLLILTIMMCSSNIFTHSFRGSVRDFCGCGKGNDGEAGNDVRSVGP